MMAENYTYGDLKANLTVTAGWRYFELRLNPLHGMLPSFFLFVCLFV
jgi:hypothetical protein